MSIAKPSSPPRNAPRQLVDDYIRVRRASIELIAPLEPEDCVVQTIPEVSPTKWHLAHVTWFFEKFCLCALEPHYKPHDEKFHYLFNSYYHTVGTMHARPQRGLLSRPTLREVLDFRERVDVAMITLLERNAGDRQLEFLVTLGLNHEQQHQELLLTDIKHVFFSNPLSPVYRPQAAREHREPIELQFVKLDGGRFSIGAYGKGFCFDNETPRHDVLVDEHTLTNRLVTNAEYRQFIDDGGYREPAVWLSDGWSTIRANDWSRPLYWSDDLEMEFTLSGWREIDPAAPVCHVSHYEADAFARWAGARLPLESELELVANDIEVSGNTLDTGDLQPMPTTDATANGRIHQIWGDVWEWTASPYVPYPRFRPLAGSLGEYNGKFMANQIVVRGGSCATWADHLRPTYRSFFYPHDRWQFLGFRLAKDVPEVQGT